MLIIFFLIFAEKKLANVGPNGDPMATPSICWNNLSLHINIPVVAIRKSFTKVPLGLFHYISKKKT